MYLGVPHGIFSHFGSSTVPRYRSRHLAWRLLRAWQRYGPPDWWDGDRVCRCAHHLLLHVHRVCGRSSHLLRRAKGWEIDLFLQSILSTNIKVVINMDS